MHARLYNELVISLQVRPASPLLIKSGRSGDDTLDPTLPDMSFVRTVRPGQAEDEVYVPGSSLRGVLRSHAEKLVRSVAEGQACDPNNHDGKGQLALACGSNVQRMGVKDRKDLAGIAAFQAYNNSCYICRLFGSTVLAGRVRVGDLYRDAARKPLLERRYGVAIDRITGAVAQGPFELEVLTDALFCGQIGLRNFTIGQFGLLAAALLDMGEGLVPVGYGKSRGLGRIEIEFGAITFRALRDPGGRLLGVGVLATDTDRASYNLPAQETDWLDMPGDNGQRGPFFTRTTGGAAAQDWLNTASARWLPEVRP